MRLERWADHLRSSLLAQRWRPFGRLAFWEGENGDFELDDGSGDGDKWLSLDVLKIQV